MRHYGHYYLTIDGEEVTHVSYSPTGGAPLCQPDTVTPDARKVEDEGQVTCPECLKLLKRSWRSAIIDGSLAGARLSYFDHEESARITVSDIEYVQSSSGHFVRFWMRGGRFPRKCFYRLARLVHILAGGNAYVLPESGGEYLN